MILTCPDCSTRYFADAATLGEEGRTVRCAACGKTWRAEREPEGGERARQAEPVRAPEPDPMEALAELDTAPREKPTAVRGPHVTLRERAARARQRTRTMAAAAAWSAIGFVFLGACAVAYVMRVDVVRAWPRAASAYAFFGVEANARGLVFEETDAQTTFEDGRTILVVSSLVRNTTGKPRDVPYVRVSLRDGDARELYDWVVALETAELGPYEETRFTALLARPPADARDLELRFIDDPDAEFDVTGETTDPVASQGPDETEAHAAPAPGAHPDPHSEPGHH